MFTSQARLDIAMDTKSSITHVVEVNVQTDKSGKL